MRRILLVNALPLVVLVAMLLYLNLFQNSLLEAEVLALREQAKIYAGALRQSAIVKKSNKSSLFNKDLYGRWQDDQDEKGEISIELARPLLLSLIEPSPNAHASLYFPGGQLVVDSRMASLEKDKISNYPLKNKNASQDSLIPFIDEEAKSNSYDTLLERVYDMLLKWLPYSNSQKIKNLGVNADPDIIPNSKQSFRFLGKTDNADNKENEIPPYIRRTAGHRLFITVAESIIYKGKIIGVIQLTREAKNVDRSLFAVRSSILMLFLLALAITVLMSWYLSLTIARPLLRLVMSAHIMRESLSRGKVVPDHLLARRDEIGDLARTLQDSARALWVRMDAIERFAADVSHELKNPLSSIRSAIELLPRVSSDSHRKRLLFIITDDVNRLDRLITDIATLSRIESEISRLIPEPVAIAPIFHLLADMNEATRKENGPKIVVKVKEDKQHPLKALAIEDRLVQVLRNLIGNAASFSPPNGIITLEASLYQNQIQIVVRDEGPGIPENKLTNIFERFYTERPNDEDLSHHSGLGLSICRQIIKALKGTIRAENLHDSNGQVIGASFVITLPNASKGHAGKIISS